MVFVDTHVHLNDPAFADDLETVVARARAADVGRMVVAGYDRASSERAVALADRYPEIWAMVGISPHEAKTWEDPSAEWLASLAKRPKVVGIGEIGLDYHYDYSPRPVQREVFRAQIELAVSAGLPIAVHSREAAADTLATLEEARGRLTGGVMHCFSGSLETARAARAMGLAISFAGPLTFKNAANLRAVAGALPPEALLTETDAPYLTPHPHRGERNEPALVPLVAAALAETRGTSLETLAGTVWANAERIYSFRHMQIAYELDGALYLNLTNACPNRCAFCVRDFATGVGGYDLWLNREPSAEQVVAAIGDPSRYREIVFCGYGEPTCRLEVLLAVARALKGRGVPLRLNTNGLGSLINGRDILPDLAGLLDVVSVSLNAANARDYDRLCHSRYGEAAFPGVVSFLRRAKEYIPRVVASVVPVEGADLEACRQLATELGVEFRVRQIIPEDGVY